MNTPRDSLPASDAERVPSSSMPEHSFGPVASADRAVCAEFGRGDGAELGGHTLLSRPPAPQGRRSLFRR